MDFELTIQGLAKKWKWINKIMGLICAGLLVLYGILSFTAFTGQINYVVLQCYYFLFAALLILAEFNVKSTLIMFGFLGNLFGKGVFVLLIGISMLAGEFSIKSIVAIILMVFGAGFIVLWIIPRRITNSAASSMYKDGATSGA
jgi:COPI associated protein